MAQYDVRINPSRQTGQDIPYLVEVQSDALDMSRRRVVVPLVRQAVLRQVDQILNPAFEIRGEALVLMPLDIAAIPEAALGETVISIKEESDRIIGALDLLLARA
ncbi:MAG: CcdB family protein [Geminicoccaceae bacterium]